MKNRHKEKTKIKDESEPSITDIELTGEIKVSDLIDGQVKKVVVFETEMYDFSK